MWLGIRNDISQHLEDASLTLDVDDVMLLYTDGVTEAFDVDKTIFSKKRLAELLRENGSLESAGIKTRIIEKLDDYEKHDDVTMIILKRVRQTA
jgi:sigma-B regulation protein RsbU (phosphoserine phosphatase)